MPDTAPRPPATPITPALRRVVLWCFALSGTASLIYEVAWAKELSVIFGSTTYAVSTMLATFMGGLALGSWLGGKRVDTPGADPLVDYIRIELLIGMSGVVGMFLLKWLPYQLHLLGGLASRSWILFFVGQVLLSALVMIVPTSLMGATFPMVTRIVAQDTEHIGASVGKVYSLNTLGAIFGSLAGGFLLIPLVRVKFTVVAAVAINALVAILIAKHAHRTDARKIIALGIVTVAIGATFAFAVRFPVIQRGLVSALRYPNAQEQTAVASSAKLLFSAFSPYGRVSVVEYQNEELSLRNGDKIEGSTDIGDQLTMRSAAYLPGAVLGSAYGDRRFKSALVIGLGTGYTTSAILDSPVDEVTTVEIDRNMVEAARFFTGDRNTADPRHELVINDARWYLAATDKRYDLITSEPSWPVGSAVTPLFTQDFFRIVHRRLEDKGVFCQWLPMYLLTEDDFMMMYRTFAQVFPNTTVWISGTDAYFIGIRGSAVPRESDVLASVKAALPSSKIESFANNTLLKKSLTSDDVPVNTDDRPLLETAVARNIIKQLGAQSESAHAERYQSGLRTY